MPPLIKCQDPVVRSKRLGGLLPISAISTHAVKGDKNG